MCTMTEASPENQHTTRRRFHHDASLIADVIHRAHKSHTSSRLILDSPNFPECFVSCDHSDEVTVVFKHRNHPTLNVIDIKEK